MPKVLVSEIASNSLYFIVSLDVYVGRSSLLKHVWALSSINGRIIRCLYRYILYLTK